jgi:hypothetical protein
MSTAMTRIAILLLATMLLGGCSSRELLDVRQDLADQMPHARLTDGRTFSFGPVSLGLGRFVLGLTGVDAEPARIALRGVRRVEVGRFKVAGPIDPTHVQMPRRLRRYVRRGDWTPLATFRTESEVGWVLYRSRGDRITGLFAAVFSGDELVLARISGDLSRVVLELIEHESIRLPGLDHVFGRVDAHTDGEAADEDDEPDDQ